MGDRKYQRITGYVEVQVVFLELSISKTMKEWKSLLFMVERLLDFFTSPQIDNNRFLLNISRSWWISYRKPCYISEIHISKLIYFLELETSIGSESHPEK